MREKTLEGWAGERYQGTMERGVIDVAYVAALARLELSAEEVARFQKQLGDVLGYVQQISKVNVEDAERELMEASAENVLRGEELKSSMGKEAVLANAPAKTNDLIVMPKIVE